MVTWEAEYHDASFYRYQPTLINSPEHYLVVWSEWRGEYFDIYGNIDIEPTEVEELPDNPLCHCTSLAPTISHGQCRLRYCIDRETRTRISLYDASGRRIYPLLDALQKPGEYDIDIPTHSLAIGVYFIHIKTDAGVAARKLTIIK